MGQFRFFTSISFALFHVVALITLIILFNLIGVDFSGTYFWTSVLAIIIAIALTIGIVMMQMKERKVGSQAKYPVMMNTSTTIILYDLVVLGLVVIGSLLSTTVYVSFHIIALIFFFFGLTVVGGFSQFVNKRDRSVGRQVDRLKQLQVHIQYVKMELQGFEGEAGVKVLMNKLNSLEEDVRYSDPISHEAVLAVEDSIEEMFLDLKERVRGIISEGIEAEAIEELTKNVDRIRHTINFRNQELRLIK
ncbi:MULTISPECIES: hypothetical protein [Bacillaceae]|uniref:Uncharacterized protein n=1 Tax=Evansella alkalicola TaxID=745819 RepID=A0ABS6JY96_9BACI|nr:MULTISPECIES: hypothetical protein [Bacillaceae]MBU9723202.1 hypothetical protein [Bacillus alkalicola]